MDRDATTERDGKIRRPYRKPEIVYTQKVEVRAVQCSKADDVCGVGGPVDS